MGREGVGCLCCFLGLGKLELEPTECFGSLGAICTRAQEVQQEMSLQDIRGAAQCGRVTRDKITTQRIYSALPAGPESPRHMDESIFSSPKSETLVPEIRQFRQPQTQHKPLLTGFVWGEAGSQLLPCTIPHLIQGGAWIRRYPGIPSWGGAGLDARERHRDAQELQVHLQPPGNGAQPRG